MSVSRTPKVGVADLRWLEGAAAKAIARLSQGAE